jgi:hypothetical protein
VCDILLAIYYMHAFVGTFRIASVFISLSIVQPYLLIAVLISSIILFIVLRIGAKPLGET